MARPLTSYKLLSPNEIEQIQNLYVSGKKQRELAEIFNCSISLISRAISGCNYDGADARGPFVDNLTETEEKWTQILRSERYENDPRIISKG